MDAKVFSHIVEELNRQHQVDCEIKVQLTSLICELIMAGLISRQRLDDRIAKITTELDQDFAKIRDAFDKAESGEDIRIKESFVDITPELMLQILRGLTTGAPRAFTVVEDPIPDDAEVIRIESKSDKCVRIVFSGGHGGVYSPTLAVDRAGETQ